MPPKPDSAEVEGLWTAQQLADHLQISVAHTYRLVRTKRIPFVRLGSNVRFEPAAIKSWLAERTVKAVS